MTGRVVVVAGGAGAVGPIAAALQDTGASVALVALAEVARTDVTVHVRADPSDADVWDRVSMHVEQHLGPVDAVVADASAESLVRAVFAADLRRRGHGDVVVVHDGDNVGDVVTRVVGTQ
ncbi:MAG: hypothetical protein JO079_09845 [Frankiaceae bacterium]|nr:hypothetical protein [Frankiaceae bacterium]MBV9369710.1 hypothetical protein [Frankiales bacterium]